MLVVAFGCTHFASPAIQRILQDKEYNYTNAQRLVEIIKAIKPQAVINLGDWEEDYYEESGVANKLCPELGALVTYKIKGNHDKSGLPFVEIDGMRYEHGHNNKVSWKLDDIRNYYKDKRVVHAHTHQPLDGIPTDVGSLTFTGTYAVVRDGIPVLERI